MFYFSIDDNDNSPVIDGKMIGATESFETAQFSLDDFNNYSEIIAEIPIEETPAASVNEPEVSEEPLVVDEPAPQETEHDKFVKLTASYEELSNKFAALSQEAEGMRASLAELREFKNKIDKQEKQKMIDSFYMLSADDKADVIANIDTYSLDEIEAKLSIICVRNKVSFAEPEEAPQSRVVDTLDPAALEDHTPAWVKAICEVAKEHN